MFEYILLNNSILNLSLNAQMSEYDATTIADTAAAILYACPGKHVNESPGYSIVNLWTPSIPIHPVYQVSGIFPVSGLMLQATALKAVDPSTCLPL